MNTRLESSFYHKVVRLPFQLRVNGHLPLLNFDSLIPKLGVNYPYEST
jgi:hypothetical protein